MVTLQEMSASNVADRDRLHGYIASSKRLQHRLTLVVIALAVASMAALAFNRPVGGLMLLGTAIIGGCGFWVTAAHIADWRLKLRTLDQNREPGSARISRKRFGDPRKQANFGAIEAVVTAPVESVDSEID